MAAPIKIKFLDGYPGFLTDRNLYTYRLDTRFDLEISDDPDFVFFGVIGYEHARARYDKCIRIWYTDENFRPDFTKCDYALTFDYMEKEPRNLRFPLYVRGCQWSWLVKSPQADLEAMLRTKTRFCNFVYANADARIRQEFFHKLSRYKRVDAAGRVCNNVGYLADNKLDFLSPYKFTIAFENASWPGYTTEKIVDPMLVGSMPIYWGNPLIERDFNPRSFVNCHEFSSLDEVVDEVIRLDQDDSLYLAKMKEPWFHDNVPNEYFGSTYLTDFFARVFEREPYSYPRWSGVIPRNFGIIQFMPERAEYLKNLDLFVGPMEHRIFE